MESLRFALAAPAVLLLPGLALAPSAAARRRLGPGLTLVWALGAAPALWALLFLWSAPFGPIWGSRFCLIVLAACVAAIVLRFRPADGRGSRAEGGVLGLRVPRLRLSALPVFVAAVAILAIAIHLRFADAAGLVAAPWVDGYHHTVITQLFVEQAGLPRDYHPYLAADGFDYHFGFHAQAAVLTWLSGAEPRLVVLWLGQLLCAIAPLGLLLLGRQLGMGLRGGLVAQALASAWLWFPPYYLSWGRYTQLCGLVVWPAALWAWQAALRPSRPRRSLGPAEADRPPGAGIGSDPVLRLPSAAGRGTDGAGRHWDGVVAAVLAAGLLLTHYRVLAFFAIAASICATGLLMRRGRRMFRVLWPAAGAGLLVAPWLARGFGARLAEWVGSGRGQAPAPPSAPVAFDFPEWVLIQHDGGFWLRLALVGLALALLNGRRGAWALLGWLVAAACATWPGLLGAGQSWALPPFALAISLWMPISLGVGLLVEGVAPLFAARTGTRAWTLVVSSLGLALAWLLRSRPLEVWIDPLALCAGAGALRLLTRRGEGSRGRRQGLRPRWGVIAFPLGLALVGMGTMPPVRNDETVILRAAELPAAAWIRDHTPPDARFFVRQVLWNQGAYRGIDGGYWLPLTAGRRTTVPPAVYALRDPALVRELEERAQILARGDGLSDAQVLALLDAAGAAWVYVGPDDGEVRGRLSAQRLARVPGLVERYADGSVSIFQRQDGAFGPP